MRIESCKKCDMCEISGEDYVTCNMLRSMYSKSALVKVEFGNVACPLEKWTSLYKNEIGDDLR